MFYTNWYTVAEGMGSAWDLCVHAVVPRAKGYHCTTRSRAEEDKMIQCGSWAKDEHCCCVAPLHATRLAQVNRKKRGGLSNSIWWITARWIWIHDRWMAVGRKLSLFEEIIDKIRPVHAAYDFFSQPYLATFFIKRETCSTWWNKYHFLVHHRCMLQHKLVCLDLKTLHTKTSH